MSERVTAAAEVLRGELEHPGGYHRGRARGIVERLTGVTLGGVQEKALDVWGRSTRWRQASCATGRPAPVTPSSSTPNFSARHASCWCR
ncbi:hypothetical protein N7U49_01035 [Streptomyces sp. AD2-2]|nr:hypothetical protein N7U49_01035 [Streptomyces sp. AD2-2]